MRNRLTELDSEVRRQGRRTSNGTPGPAAASLGLAGVGPRRGQKRRGSKARRHGRRRAPGARAFSTPVDYTVPDPVPVIAQPSSMACWATVFTMLYSWKRQQSMAIQTALADVGQRWVDLFNANTGITGDAKVQFLTEAGLQPQPPQSHSVAGWEQLLRTYGPLWVTGDEAPGAAWAIHARVIVGIKGDGTPNGTKFTIIDPAGGRRYEESIAVFIPKYEEEVRRTGYMRVQVIHWPRDARLSSGQSRAVRAVQASGRASLRQAYQAGYARAKQEEASRAKDGGASVAVAIAGIAIGFLSDNEGDVSWHLAQWRGKKRPWDRADLEGPSVYQNQTVPLHNWPRPGTVGGLDEIYLPLDVKWQYNGSTVANIEILPGTANDAVGAGLRVEAHLMDDQNGYRSTTDPSKYMAAVKVTITYRYTNIAWGDDQARTELWLFGDGTHRKVSRWL